MKEKMKLVIAEKPSVAMSLAKVLGAKSRKESYMEGGGYLVSWCVGHLAGLAAPEVYNKNYARQQLANDDCGQHQKAVCNLAGTYAAR